MRLLWLQELLKRYGTTEESRTHRSRGSRESTPTETNTLFIELPSDIQNVVRPYLDSKFQLHGSTARISGVIIRSDMSFRRWLTSWMRQLTEHHASGMDSVVAFHPKPGHASGHLLLVKSPNDAQRASRLAWLPMCCTNFRTYMHCRQGQVGPRLPVCSPVTVAMPRGQPHQPATAAQSFRRQLGPFSF